MAIRTSLLKQLLAAVHRYLGLAGCVLFLLWFLSGLVMMYVEMPYLARSDSWLDGLRALDASTPLIGPQAAVDASGIDQPARRLFVEMQGGAPVWRVVTARGPIRTIRAAESSSGPNRLLGPWDAEQGFEIAQEWARYGGEWDGELVFDRSFEVDQWTLSGGLFAAHRPLHRFRVEGPSRTHVYVAQATGRVVQVTTARERLLGYLGPVTHWIYPTFLRRHGSLWANLVVVVSTLGILVVVLGLVLGVWNLRRGSKLGVSPFKERWMRWHHVFGLVFGLVTLTWVFSGLMSMAPLDWAPSTSPTAEEARLLAGDRSSWSDFAVSPQQALATFGDTLRVKELEAIFFAGEPYWLAWETPRRSMLLPASRRDADSPAAETSSIVSTATIATTFSEDSLRAAIERLRPGGALLEWRRLDDYDNDYTSKKTFESRRRLPVYRATFDDTPGTTYYLDPHKGTLAMRMEPRSRLSRYLYQGLHSWDVFGFHNRRPWWDLTVGAFMLGGVFASWTSVVISVRWLRRRARRRSV